MARILAMQRAERELLRATPMNRILEDFGYFQRACNVRELASR